MGCTLEGYSLSLAPLPASCHFLKDKKEEPGMVVHTQTLAAFLCYSLLFRCLKSCLGPSTVEPADYRPKLPNMGAKLKLSSFRLLFLQYFITAMKSDKHLTLSLRTHWVSASPPQFSHVDTGIALNSQGCVFVEEGHRCCLLILQCCMYASYESAGST